MPNCEARSRTTAGQLRPQLLDGLHARLHDAFLQLAHDQAESLHRLEQHRVVAGLGVRHDLVAGQHELADLAHQGVEQVDVHADRALGDGRLVIGGRSSSDGGLGASGHHDLLGGGSRGHLGLQGTSASSARTGTAGSASAAVSSGAASGVAGPRALALLGRDVLEAGHEVAELGVALLAGGLDRLEQAAHGVDHLEEDVGALLVQHQDAVAELRQQVLADVRDLLERGKPRKPLVPLMVWNVRKTLASRSAEVGSASSADQVAVELVEVLGALDQEFLDDFVHLVVGHGRPPSF